MSRSAVEVRRAVPADLDALADLVAGLEAEPGEAGTSQGAGERPGARERLATAIGRPEIHLLVAATEGRAVGLAVLRRGEMLPLDGRDALHVEHLAVHPGWRRRGVAGLLLAQVAAAAEEAGCRDVTCATPAGHREANRFLARLGFAPAVTRRVTPAAALRARLARRAGGQASRGVVQQVLVRRRLERGRRGLAPVRTGAPQGPDGAG